MEKRENKKKQKKSKSKGSQKKEKSLVSVCLVFSSFAKKERTEHIIITQI